MNNFVSIELGEAITRQCLDLANSLMRKRVEAGLPAGGVSRLRESEERQKYLIEDGWIGNLGFYAASRYLTGSIDAFQQHQNININPGKGDGGCDIPFGSLQIDIKTSLWRNRQIPKEEHHLLVRSKERHLNSIYVFCLVERFSKEEGAKVWLIGWASDDDFSREPIQAGKLKGAYGIKASNLKSIPQLQQKYQFFKKHNKI